MQRFALLLAAASFARAGNPDAPELNARGVELEQLSRFSEAEGDFKAALDLCRQTGCPELPVILNNLGSLYYMTVRYREAEPVLREAIALAPATGGNADRLASALANLATVYRAEARYAEAVPLYERALKVRQADPETPALEFPKLRAKMALLAQDMGDLVNAEKTIREALSMLERRGAIESGEGANVLTDFAGILESEAKADAAEEPLQRALAIRERLLGPQNPAIAVALSKLGQAYRLENRLAKAEQAYRQALAIERTQAPSPDLSETLNNLGNVLASQRRWKEAEALLREAIATWEKLLGPEHPSVAAGLGNLAALLQSRNRYDEAERLIERARQIDEKSLPPGHPRIGLDLNSAATLAFRRKQYAKAEDLCLASVAILEKALSAAHPQTGLVLANLAEIYRMQKRWAESAQMYKRAVDILVKAWGPDDERLLVSLEHYASVLRMRGEYAEAGKIDIQTTRIRTVHALRKETRA
jgi:tetratricopeptide (TPR) repeat protein